MKCCIWTCWILRVAVFPPFISFQTAGRLTPGCRLNFSRKYSICSGLVIPTFITAECVLREEEEEEEEEGAGAGCVFVHN